MLRALRFVGNLVFWLVIVALLAVALAVRFDVARIHTMRTGSMAPDYPTGALVVLTKNPRADVAVGDAIAFVPPGRDPEDRYVHRITELDTLDDGTLVVTTKGDANPAVDDFAPFRLSAQELWTARVAVPSGGTFLATLGTPQVRNILITVGAVALAGPLLWFIWRPRRDDDSDSDEPGAGEGPEGSEDGGDPESAPAAPADSPTSGPDAGSNSVPPPQPDATSSDVTSSAAAVQGDSLEVGPDATPPGTSA